MKAETGSPVVSKMLIAALLQAVLFSSIWLWDEYVATYVTLILPAVMLVVLLLSAIADWIEPSRIPGWYYVLMLVSIVIPVMIAIIFYIIYDGQLTWLEQ